MNENLTLEKIIQKNAPSLSKKLDDVSLMRAHLVFLVKSQESSNLKNPLEILKEIEDARNSKIINNIIKGNMLQSQVLQYCGNDYSRFIQYLNRKEIKSPQYPDWTETSLEKFGITRQMYQENYQNQLRANTFATDREIMEECKKIEEISERTKHLQEANISFTKAYDHRHVVELYTIKIIKRLIDKYTPTFANNYEKLLSSLEQSEITDNEVPYIEASLVKLCPDFSQQNIKKLYEEKLAERVIE